MSLPRKELKRYFLAPTYMKDYLLGCMNIVVLPPTYKYPELPLVLRKCRLDTRVFTSPHAMGLLNYGGSWTSHGLVKLRMTRSSRSGHSEYSGDSFTGCQVMSSPLLILMKLNLQSVQCNFYSKIVIVNLKCTMKSGVFPFTLISSQEELKTKSPLLTQTVAKCMNNIPWTTAVTPCGWKLHALTADQEELNWL